MKLRLAAFLFVFLASFPTSAREWIYDDWTLSASGHLQGLYGYSDVSSRFKPYNQENHGIGQGDLSFAAVYQFNEDYAASLNLDLMGGIDQKLKDYNQGSWGEEAYMITDTPLGRLMLGQTFNVDAQFHEGAPSAGAIGTENSEIVDFIANPNWQRDKHTTRFATLNTTYINTDGVAPKVSYISPAYYNTLFGISYIPDAYNRRGLINKRASYSKDDGYVAALYTSQEWGGITLSGSLGFAQFHDDDKEYSASLRLKRGNWSLGGGWRKTYVDGKESRPRRVSGQLPLLFDNYREGQAWNAGIGYEIGPVTLALSYFESKAERTANKDKIALASGQYQVNAYADLYLAAAHVDFEGADHLASSNNQGYAFIAGIGLNF